jgi:hypothetical protein
VVENLCGRGWNRSEKSSLKNELPVVRADGTSIHCMLGKSLKTFRFSCLSRWKFVEMLRYWMLLRYLQTSRDLVEFALETYELLFSNSSDCSTPFGSSVQSILSLVECRGSVAAPIVENFILKVVSSY